MLTTLFRCSWLRIAVSLLLLAALGEPAVAQLPGLGAAGAVGGGGAQPQQAQQRVGQQPTLSPNIELYQPVAPDSRPTAPGSVVEGQYSARMTAPNYGTPNSPSQFGYDVFGVPTAFQSAQLGAQQDNYVLGVGDQVVIVLRGPEDQTISQEVNRDGQVIMPKLTPIQAAGRTLGEFRADVERRVAQTFISTTAFVSLGQVRQISVMLAGDVRAPGTRILSALATPLDAILLSGGIAKTGTLRNIKLIRGNETRTIDLYPLLTQGSSVNLGTIENGDRIFVPPLGKTVAVTGLIHHPAIYELKSGETAMDSKSLIELAGGLAVPGPYRLAKISIQQNGDTRFEDFTGGMIHNGEILSVGPVPGLRLDSVVIKGAVRVPGPYPLPVAQTVRQLLSRAGDISQDAYPAFAIMSRRDPVLNLRTTQVFSVSRLLTGVQPDIKLQNEDIVYIFTSDEIRSLASALSPKAADVLGPIAPAQTGGPLGATGREGAVPDPRLSTAGSAPAPETRGVNSGVGGSPSTVGVLGSTQSQFLPPAPNLSGTITAAALERAQQEIANSSGTKEATGGAGAIASALSVPDPVVSNTVKDNLVWLYDEVKNPGPYLAAPGTDLRQLVLLAGGPLRTADLSAVEVTSTEINAATGTARTVRTNYKGTVDDFQRVIIQPEDVVRFRPIFSDRDLGLITITGEVRYPGTFDIRRGERLSSVLARAGGLTEQAYPLGAVFTRKSAALFESEANQREARELEIALASAIQRGSLTSNLGQSTGGGGGVAPVYANGAAIGNPGLPSLSGASGTDVIGTLITELRTSPATGRMTVTADPSVLQVRPEFDVVVEGGDTLYIPKRPSTVTVTGEVLNSGTFAFRNDYSVQDYVQLAGGSRDSADEGRIFVIMPDGTARPMEDNWLTFNHNTIIPPGSTIVVPREVAPFNFFTTFVNITQITSSLALTAAALAILAHP